MIICVSDVTSAYGPAHLISLPLIRRRALFHFRVWGSMSDVTSASGAECLVSSLHFVRTRLVFLPVLCPGMAGLTSGYR